jgi:hypothetical protein
MITKIQMTRGGNVWKAGMVVGFVVSRQTFGEESVFIAFLA